MLCVACSCRSSCTYTVGSDCHSGHDEGTLCCLAVQKQFTLIHRLTEAHDKPARMARAASDGARTMSDTARTPFATLARQRTPLHRTRRRRTLYQRLTWPLDVLIVPRWPPCTDDCAKHFGQSSGRPTVSSYNVSEPHAQIEATALWGLYLCRIEARSRDGSPHWAALTEHHIWVRSEAISQHACERARVHIHAPYIVHSSRPRT
jgi:hypothetical protein